MEKDLGFITPVSSKSTVDYITDELLDAIISGRWKPGTKIPTETELMGAFHTGRNSVREAIKVLVALGLLNIRRSDGTYVATTFSEKMLNPLIYSFALEEDTGRQLLELRKMFNYGCSELAAINAADEDLEKINAAFQHYRELLLLDGCPADDLLDADIAFHDEVSKAAHNTLLYRISYVIEQIGRPERIQSMDYIVKNGHKDYLITSHSKIAQAIASRDLEAVRQAVSNSFKYLEITTV